MAALSRARCFVALLCAALASLPARAQPQQPSPYSDSAQIPGTPAYTRAREVLDLVNAADLPAYQHYVQESFAPDFRNAVPMEVHSEVYQDVVSGSGNLALHGARSYTPPRAPTNAVLIVFAPIPEQWQAIVVDVEAEAPHRITRLSFDRARPPSDLPQKNLPALTDAQIAAELGAYMDRLATHDAFSGTVLVARNGEPVFTRAVGFANRDFKSPNTLETKFNLGSMNKMFTAVAILQLSEQGKLALDDPLAKYLDTSWLPQDTLGRVTIRHLLTHTSGLGSYFNETFDRSSRALYRSVSDYKPLVSDETPAFEPGTRFQYSNTGFLIAGAVVEKAAGMDYFDYIRKNVTGPAGMTSTDCYELDHVNDNLAVGYDRRLTPRGVEYQNNIFMHVIRGGPAGGGYSTVTDLFRFAEALRAGKLLKKESLDAAWTPDTAAHPTYGLGFFVQQTSAGKIVGHSGGFNGISADLSMYMGSGYTVAVLCNDGRAAPLVQAKAQELIAQGR